MGKVVRGVLAVGLLVAGLATGNPFLISVGASMTLASATEILFAPKLAVPQSQFGRLNVSLDTNAPRKAVFGTTAMPLDLRYHEAGGTDQEYIDYIICVAAHKVQSIDEIYFEEKKAWDSSTGVTATYSGYLTVQTRLEGTDANYISINSGNRWGSDDRLTGCAYVYFRIKRSGNTKKTESPLVQGLPSRVTIIGEGVPLYDPRLDSTVTGGSGSHRADDQDTWGLSYSPADSYDNPALHLLFMLLGWKINDKLSIGAGVPPARIDMESFITAANICDEDVTLSIGGTQKRYRTSGTFSDADDRMDVMNTLLACMNGTLRDNGGKLSLDIIKNDLADPILEFTDDDVLSEFEWDQTGGGLSQNHNIARGRYVDPSLQGLYQMTEYPNISITSPDGIERVMSLDFPFVEDGRRAQRLAKQILQRNQFRGQLTAEFTAKAMGCDVGDIVTITLSALGFNDKLFRVISKEISPDGRVPLTLLEENALIYQWDNEDSAPVVPVTPVIYDPLLNMITQGDEAVQAIAEQAIADAAGAQSTADGKIESFYQSTMPSGSLGDFWIDTDDGNKLYRHNGTTFIEVQDDAIATAISDAAGAQATADGKVTTFYSTSAPTAEGVGDLWYDTDDKVLYRWDGSNWSNSVSDITQANQITFSEVDPYYIQADSTGTTTTSLPVTRAIKVFKGGTQQTSGVTVGTLGLTSGITATASVSSGLVTVSLSVADAVGYITVPITFDSQTYDRLIVVNRALAAPIVGGSSGSSSFTDQTWTNISTTTYTQVTDSGAIVQSNGSGELKFTANASYEGDSAATIQAQYSTDGSSWTAAATATGSTPINIPGEEMSGFISISPTTVTGLTASTDYYVRLVAKRTTGSGTISWGLPTFTAQQP